MARRPRRHWIFQIESSEGTELRQLRLSRDVVRGTIALVLLGVAVLSSAATRAFVNADGAVRPVGRRAGGPEAELLVLRAQIDSLRGSLDELTSRDEYFRLLAGHEPTAAIRPVSAEPVEELPVYAASLTAFNDGIAQTTTALTNEVSSLLRRAHDLATSWSEAKDTLQRRYDRLASTPSILPTFGYVSSAFSQWRIHPILSRPRPHLGVDIVARRGTPIVAAAKGRVRFVGYAGEYGLTVEVDHGYGFVTRYAHASRATVRLGQPVERGDLIGHVGDTGLAVGPHLHYEVLVNGRQANPRRYMFETGVVTD
jgi:murein DD-endopeptidase MepM/ murein hydrolase activator NlpD